MNTRKSISSAQRLRILEENSYRCIYCGDAATQVDHTATQKLVTKKPSAPTTPSIVLDTLVTPEMIRSIRQELNQSLSEFGATLKHAIDPRAKYPYSRQYISRLEHGQDVITPELTAAFYNIAAVLDDVPAGVGGAVAVSVLAQPGQVPSGAFVPRSAKVLRCARPGCNVLFVRSSPRQIYHDPECRR